METDFEKMERKIDEYFSNISDDELAGDVEKARYSFYKKVKAKLLDTYPEAAEMTFWVRESRTVLIREVNFDFKKLCFPDSYAFDYKLAA